MISARVFAAETADKVEKVKLSDFLELVRCLGKLHQRRTSVETSCYIDTFAVDHLKVSSFICAKRDLLLRKFWFRPVDDENRFGFRLRPHFDVMFSSFAMRSALLQHPVDSSSLKARCSAPTACFCVKITRLENRKGSGRQTGGRFGTDGKSGSGRTVWKTLKQQFSFVLDARNLDRVWKGLFQSWDGRSFLFASLLNSFRRFDFVPVVRQEPLAFGQANRWDDRRHPTDFKSLTRIGIFWQKKFIQKLCAYILT